MQGVGSDQILLLGAGNADANTLAGVTAAVSSQWIDVSSYDELTFFFESLGVTSGGTVLIEEASRTNYSGVGGTIQTISASAFTGTAQQPYHISQNAYSAVRVRISSPITGGGSILVWLRRRGV